MSKDRLLAFLAKQGPKTLVALLETAYEEMHTDQREAVFGEAMRKVKPGAVNGNMLLKEAEQFRRDSLAGEYYAPFDIIRTAPTDPNQRPARPPS